MPQPSDFVVPLPPDDAWEMPAVALPEMDRHRSIDTGCEDDWLLTDLQPPHPELDEAIDSGSSLRVLDELSAARRRFSPEATLNTAVVHAIRSGRSDMLRVLIDNSVPLSTNNLEDAARSGHIPCLALLMEHLHWHVNSTTYHGHTCLILAVEHLEMVAWLLSQGADVNKQDLHSETPLSRAIERGPEDVVNLLLESGADISRGTPLVASLIRFSKRELAGGMELMEGLIARGAPVNKFAGEGSQIWEEFNMPQLTALHVATDLTHRNVNAVKLLLAHGGDPLLNTRLRGVERPNTSAWHFAQLRGYTDIVSAMEEHMQGSGASQQSNL